MTASRRDTYAGTMLGHFSWSGSASSFQIVQSAEGKERNKQSTARYKPYNLQDENYFP